jgi:hypothetical protein
LLAGPATGQPSAPTMIDAPRNVVPRSTPMRSAQTMKTPFCAAVAIAT